MKSTLNDVERHHLRWALAWIALALVSLAGGITFLTSKPDSAAACMLTGLLTSCIALVHAWEGYQESLRKPR